MSVNKGMSQRLEIASRVLAQVITRDGIMSVIAKDETFLKKVCLASIGAADELIRQDIESFGQSVEDQRQLILDLAKAAVALPVLVDLKERAKQLIQE